MEHAQNILCASRSIGADARKHAPVFVAALAMGGDEIEFDVRMTRDGQMVVSHDRTLDRIFDCTGKVDEHSLAEHPVVLFKLVLIQRLFGIGSLWQTIKD